MTGPAARRSRPSSTRCCAGCACPTCAKPHPTCSPPPAPNDGSPPRCSASCSPRKSPAATPPPAGCAARPPRSPPARPSPPGGAEESSIPEATQNALATLEWIGRAENLVIAGPSGTGKSHLVEALAHAAIEKDLRVAWFTLETLTAAIGRAKADGSVARTVTRICRSDLIVVDDIGMLPAGQDAAEAFYRITDAAYERRSVAVTSNIHPSGFDTIMPKTLATATVDRLLHHAHLVLTKGDSHRLAEALTGKGVIPLAT